MTHKLPFDERFFKVWFGTETPWEEYEMFDSEEAAFQWLESLSDDLQYAMESPIPVSSYCFDDDRRIEQPPPDGLPF